MKDKYILTLIIIYYCWFEIYGSESSKSDHLLRGGEEEWGTSIYWAVIFLSHPEKIWTFFYHSKYFQWNFPLNIPKVSHHPISSAKIIKINYWNSLSESPVDFSNFCLMFTMCNILSTNLWYGKRFLKFWTFEEQLARNM